MFKKGQKVYRLTGYYNNAVEEWTFIRKETERNGGGWIFYDEDDRYRTMFDINEFTDDKEYIELQIYKSDLKKYTNAIREHKEDIELAESDIISAKNEIERLNKDIAEMHITYSHLVEKYPEEFI